LYLSFVNAAAGYAVYGNPDLRPERSTSTSLGAEWSGANAFLQTTGFNADYRDFIETGAPDATGTYTYNNVARGWTRGLEIESGLMAGDWRLEAAGERLWTRDASTGSSLLGRTPFTVRASGTGPVASWTRATLRFAYIARTPISRDSVGTVTVFRGAYPQLDARLSRLIGTRFELSAEVTNLLDRQMGDSWPGFMGRRAMVQLRWRNQSIE